MNLAELSPKHLNDGIEEAMALIGEFAAPKPILAAIVTAGMLAAQQELADRTFGGDRTRTAEFFGDDDE